VTKHKKKNKDSKRSLMATKGSNSKEINS